MGSEPRMPTFLKIVMVGAAVVGPIGLLLSTISLLAIAFVPGPYMVNGRRASPDEFLAFAIPALASYFLICAATIAVARGLRRRRLWARPLIVAAGVALIGVPLLLVFLGGLPLLGLRWIVPVLMIVVLWWQLYYDDDIVAYHASLREAAQEAERG
jgi:hypothetical protein